MTFEEAIPIIDKILECRRYKWQLRGISWISWEDVAQIIRLHLFKKFNLFDQTQQLEPWVSKVIASQMINLSRNIYYSSCRPCLKCPSSEGTDLCAVTPSGRQCSECVIYKHWEKTKKNAYNIRLPVSMESHTQEVFDIPHQELDIDKAAKVIHREMKKILKIHEWRVYECLYILELSEEQTAIRCNFRSNESGRAAGYARIKQIQKIIIKKVKELLENADLF